MNIEIVRHWSISTVYRATTRMGKYYFKQSPTFFLNEVPVTVAVANRFPYVSPRVLASDARSRWMLLDDLGDVTMESADPHTSEGAALWIAVVRSLARIQAAYAISPSDLDLERRSTDATLATIREWTTAPPLARLHYAAADTSAALCRLTPLLPRLDELRAALIAANLPSTLCHGDLDAGNIFVRDGEPVLMDWSDACISNPLFDAVQIPQVADNPRIASAYLSQWTDRAPMKALQTAFRAAAPIGALERAIHYRRNIVPYILSPSDDRRHLEAYIPDLLNRAADLLLEPSAAGSA